MEENQWMILVLRPNDTPFEDGTFRLLLGRFDRIWLCTRLLGICLKNLRNLIQISHHRFDLHQKCFIQMVNKSDISSLDKNQSISSLCRWRHLSWYSSKSLVTDIWCFSYTHFHSSRTDRLTMKSFIVTFSRYWMNQMFRHQRILKQPISIKAIDASMKNAWKWL